MHLSFVILVAVLGCLASADVLNITSCYCHETSETNHGSDVWTKTGVFYSFDLWIKQLDKTFSFNYTERIDGRVDPIENHDDTPPPSPVMHPICAELTGPFEMCYWRRGYDRHGRIAFNNDIRLLSRKRNKKHQHREWAYPVCLDRCLSEFGFIDMDTKRSNFGTWDEILELCIDNTPGTCPWIDKDRIGH